MQERLIGRGPGDLARREKLAEYITDVGFVYFKRHDFPAAIRGFSSKFRNSAYRLSMRSQTVRRRSNCSSLLSLSHYNVATCTWPRSKTKRPFSHSKSRSNIAPLVDLHPSVSSFQEQLAKSYREVAIEEHKGGHSEIGLLNLRKALDILEKLSRWSPTRLVIIPNSDEPGTPSDTFTTKCGITRRQSPRLTRPSVSKKTPSPRSPDDNEYKMYLCIHLENLGEQYLDLGSVSDAWPYYMRAIEMRRKLNTDHPENVDYAQILADSLSRLGAIKRNASEPTAALKLFAEERTVAERFLKTKPENSTMRCRLADAFTREAWAQFDLKQTDDALKSLEEAARALKPLANSPSVQSERRDYLTEVLRARAVLLRSLNQSAGADKADGDRLALWDGQAGQGLANLALVQVGRAALIGYGKTPLAGPGRLARDLDLDLAAINLKLAMTRGFTDLPAVRSRPESTVLLERDDIKPLISGLESRKSSAAANRPNRTPEGRDLRLHGRSLPSVARSPTR